MSRILTPARLSAAALLAPLLLAAPAAAGTAKHADPAKDVVATTNESDTQTDPDEQFGDWTSFRVEHAGTTVRLTGAMRQLRKADYAYVEGRLNTPARDYDYELYLATGDVVLSSPKDGLPVDCTGLEARRNTRKDRVSITVPRSCLGQPDWVRVSAVFTWSRRVESGAIVRSVDNAYRRGLGDATSDRVQHG